MRRQEASSACNRSFENIQRPITNDILQSCQTAEMLQTSFTKRL